MLNIQNSPDTKCQLTLKILDQINYSKNSISDLKRKKMKNHQWILYIWINLGSKFQIQQFWFFETNLPQKRILPVKNIKNKRHHWIVHIRISLSTKFQLKLTILIFWTKFVQKRYFQLKTEKVNSLLNSADLN